MSRNSLEVLLSFVDAPLAYSPPLSTDPCPASVNSEDWPPGLPSHQAIRPRSEAEVAALSGAWVGAARPELRVRLISSHLIVLCKSTEASVTQVASRLGFGERPVVSCSIFEPQGVQSTGKQ